jgi:multiple sugar transport system ATP-binding protein
MARISLNKLVKRFGATEVIREIDLEIDEGEFIVLVGPSGCGKSTLLNLVAGLETATDGDILIGGERVNDIPPKDRDIAMVFQSYALYPTKSVRDNITFGMKARGASRAEQDAAVSDVSELLHIGTLLDRKPSQLSGGQRQRVAMGRALVRKPAVFLFDEPLSNLDAKLRIEMRTEIKKLHQRLGKTTIYVTHDQIEAMTLASRIAVMDNGRIRQFDTPHAIYEEPADLFVAGFIGSPPMNMLTGRLRRQDGLAVEVGETSGPKVIFPLPPHLAGRVTNPEGHEVVLGLRPEAIFARGADGSGPVRFNFEAPVEVVEPTGPDTMLVFRVAGQEMIARVRPEDAPSSVGSFAFEVDMAKVKLFDGKTQQKL